MTSIIPAIDIIGGKCVRLTQGDYDRRSEYGDPIDMARAFEDAGCQRLHLVDLDGAKASHIVNYRTLESIATRTSLVIDFGGGVKSDDDIRIAFDSGAAMVTGGSVVNFIAEYIDKGITQAICTDIACDGTLQGPSVELYSEIIERCHDLLLIASGGIGSMADVEALDKIGIKQVIVGKAIYEGKISLKEIEHLNLT